MAMKRPHREGNEQKKIAFPRIIMTGLRYNTYGGTRTVIEVVMDIPMAAHAEDIIEKIKYQCNIVRNTIEEETHQSFYYGIQNKDDIWRGHPGLAIYIDFANNLNLPIEAVHGREHRVLPRFIDAVETALAYFRKVDESDDARPRQEIDKDVPASKNVSSLWTDVGA